MLSDQTIRNAIIDLCAARAPKTICPSEVARHLFLDEQAWRQVMPHIRKVATELATELLIEILQKGLVVPPTGVYHGAIRLRRRLDS